MSIMKLITLWVFILTLSLILINVTGNNLRFIITYLVCLSETLVSSHHHETELRLPCFGKQLQRLL
jgi:hypothetical protein